METICALRSIRLRRARAPGRKRGRGMGWFILAGVVLLLALLLAAPLSLHVSCDNGEFSLTAGYLWFKYPLPLEKKGPAPKKAGPKKKAPEQPKQKEEPPKEKAPFSQSVHLIWDFITAAAEDFGILLSKLRLYGLTLRLTLAGEDAAQTGIRYGQACVYVYSGLALVQGLMSVRKVGQIQVAPDFEAQAPRSDYFFSFCLKLRAGSLLRAALRILFRFLLRTLKRDKPPARNQSVSHF